MSGELSLCRWPARLSLVLQVPDGLDGRRQPLALSDKPHAAGLLPFVPIQPLVPRSVAFTGHILGIPPCAHSPEITGATEIPTYRPPVPVALGRTRLR
jgi:hypothetical protein